MQLRRPASPFEGCPHAALSRARDRRRPGRDHLVGDSGNDLLRARDSEPDVIDCSVGFDTVLAELPTHERCNDVLSDHGSIQAFT